MSLAAVCMLRYKFCCSPDTESVLRVRGTLPRPVAMLGPIARLRFSDAGSVTIQGNGENGRQGVEAAPFTSWTS